MPMAKKYGGIVTEIDPKALKAALKTLEEMEAPTPVADIEHFGDKILIPEAMTIPQAMQILQRRQEYLQERTRLVETFDVFPWDGANATRMVLTEMFGWAPAGEGSPSVKVATGPRPEDHIYVPWGEFEIPNSGITLFCDVSKKKGRFVFELVSVCRRQDEATVQDIFAKIGAYLKTGSIYRGKAIKMRFLNENGDVLAMPEPEFIDIAHVNREQLILSQHIHDSIETNLFTPLERVDDCLNNDLPIKRAVILGGTFGTGKTLAATVAAKIATDNGLTFLYVPRADELKMAIEFARQYQSPACALFCEDIDRVLNGDRDVSMDDILNIVDGIDSKTHRILMVFTTNEMEKINPAMIRPGRLDCVIEVTPPDGEAVTRLLKHYAGDALDPNADLTEAGEVLAGQIPAVIAEVVKRAKFAELKRLPKGAKISGLSDVSILEASLTMKGQTDLLARLIEAEKRDNEMTFEDYVVEMIRKAGAEVDD